MDKAYNLHMDTDTKDRLAGYGDMGLVACALRLQAARSVAGVSQATVAEACRIKKTAYSNMETARSFPSRPVMQFFFRQHRIDFNFLMFGDYARLSADVQAALFPALEAVRREWGRREDSDRSQATKRPVQAKTT